MENDEHLSTTARVLLGSSSGVVAACLLHPLEVVKVHMQMQSKDTEGPRHYRNMMHCVLDVVNREGPLRLYAGVSACLLRQLIHTTTRLSVYCGLLEIITCLMPAPPPAPPPPPPEDDKWRIPWLSKVPEPPPPTPPPPPQGPGIVTKFLFGMAAGGVAAVASTPAELMMVRMASDGRLKKRDRRNYRSIVEGLRRTYQDEGFQRLWTGARPALLLDMVSAGVSIAAYSQMRQGLISWGMDGDSGKCYFLSGLWAGLLTAIVTVPIDFAKTRIQLEKAYKEFKGHGKMVWQATATNDGTFYDKLRLVWRTSAKEGEKLYKRAKWHGKQVWQTTNARLYRDMKLYGSVKWVWKSAISRHGVHYLWTGLLPYAATLTPYLFISTLIYDLFVYLYKTYTKNPQK